MPVTESEVNAIVRGLVPEVKAYVARTQEPLVARLAGLEKLVGELERRLSGPRDEK